MTKVSIDDLSAQGARVPGRGWSAEFASVGLPTRRLLRDAEGDPLYLARPRSLADFRVFEMLDEIGRDRPRLPEPFPALVSRADASQPIAVVGAEFFGGRGFQWSAAWTSSELVFGPVITATDSTEVQDDRFDVVLRADMAINRLLRWLGVYNDGAVDEFAAVGLGSSRGRDDDPPIR
jgi:hypothetical protein